MPLIPRGLPSSIEFGAVNLPTGLTLVTTGASAADDSRTTSAASIVDATMSVRAMPDIAIFPDIVFPPGIAHQASFPITQIVGGSLHTTSGFACRQICDDRMEQGSHACCAADPLAT
jgi:hypothetical protein